MDVIVEGEVGYLIWEILNRFEDDFFVEFFIDVVWGLFLYDKFFYRFFRDFGVSEDIDFIFVLLEVLFKLLEYFDVGFIIFIMGNFVLLNFEVGVEGEDVFILNIFVEYCIFDGELVCM